MSATGILAIRNFGHLPAGHDLTGVAGRTRPPRYVPGTHSGDTTMKKIAMFAVMLLVTGPVVAQPAATVPSTASPNAPATNAPTRSAPAQSAPHGTATEARVNERIAQMHQRLKITPAQQAAWDAFTQVMRDNVTSTEQAYKERRDGIATMSAPDNMRNFAQIEQARAQGIQNLATSFQTLYDAMSDDQKKTADAMFRHYEDRGPAPGKAAK
jgi:protein CpxP